jgi:hypothetical protein
MTKRKVIQGGKCKTYCIEKLNFISKAAKTPKQKMLLLKTIPAVKDGAVDILKNHNARNGRWNQDLKWRDNPQEYTFSNGSEST